MYGKFKKPPAKKIEITPRDELVIMSAYKHRLITTDDIQKLTGWDSRRKMNDRLRQLWGNDFLDQPEAPNKMYMYDAKRPKIHALNNKGADLLRSRFGVVFPRSINWEKDNAELKNSSFVPHTLGITKTMVQAECDFREEKHLRLVERDELWENSPDYNPRLKRPFSFPTVLVSKDGERVNRPTIPDALFGIYVDSNPEDTGRGLNFLEYDRIVEGYMRKSLKQSSIYQKYLGYGDLYQRKLHARFGFDNKFRVLFVIESRPDKDADKHIRNMIDLFHAQDIKKRFGVPAGMFLYTTTEKLFNDGFLAPVWVNLNRKSVSLV